MDWTRQRRWPGGSAAGSGGLALLTLPGADAGDGRHSNRPRVEEPAFNQTSTHTDGGDPPIVTAGFSLRASERRLKPAPTVVEPYLAHVQPVTSDSSSLSSKSGSPFCTPPNRRPSNGGGRTCTAVACSSGTARNGGSRRRSRGRSTSR